ncbi:hypothetical protein AB4Y44_18910 [Paraburkholderia sp. BR10937]|uniref:hypothetical protein n=1 Tax=Paraburkholderia sp. BR10937 TaxID=3236994 RepID=UPI0034D1EC94
MNLRLLAAIYAGQVRDKAIVADEFLYYADLLASLRHDEIVLLGTLLRNSTAYNGDTIYGNEPMHRTRSELVPDVFAVPEDYNAALGALLRTGLVSTQAIGGSIGGGPSMVYHATSLLRRLNALAEIEGVMSREQASTARAEST